MDDEPFRIELTRTGGFGGIRLHGSLDVTGLAPAQAAALTQLVDQVDFDVLQRTPPQPTSPDEFRYDLTVTRGDRRHHLVMGDRNASPELHALLARLAQLIAER